MLMMRLLVPMETIEIINRDDDDDEIETRGEPCQITAWDCDEADDQGRGRAIGRSYRGPNVG